ncbi:MAG: TonB family protein [Nevskia sp.]|nr:TonB family protein [Nevskia sp.]
MTVLQDLLKSESCRGRGGKTVLRMNPKIQMRRSKATLCCAAGAWTFALLVGACAEQPSLPRPGDDDYPGVRYPSEAFRLHEEGTAIVRVRIRRDGTVESAKLLKSSGFQDLDDEAVAVFYRIKKFPLAADDVKPGIAVFEQDMPITFSLK